MEAILCKGGTETPEPVKAEVFGTIPPWLQGTLLRNGPGLFSIGDVYYRSKFLRSVTYMKNITANRIVVSEFGTLAHPDPCKNIFSRAFTYLVNTIGDFTDNNIVNIIRYGDDYYASSEINYINQINPGTLDTVGRVNYRDHIALNLATSHPHYDDEKNTYNMGTAIMALSGPKYVIFKVPASASDVTDNKRNKIALKNLQQICSIPVRSKLFPSYFHSFGMTEHYIIFVEQPFKLDIIRLATAYIRGETWGSASFMIKMILKTGVAVNTKFYGDAFVVFHHINAYEEDGHIVFDLITYKDSKLYDLFYIDSMKRGTQEYIEMIRELSPAVCQRYIIPVNADLKRNPLGKNLVRLEGTSAAAVLQEDGSVSCTPETLFQGLEMPGINYGYNGKKYRYFYGSVIDWTSKTNKITKVDTNTKTHLEWLEEDCYPSEPKFVASPGAVDEDDGVVLSLVVSVNPKKSPFMLVLDAKNLKEIARATVNAPVHLDLHGLFIPE